MKFDNTVANPPYQDSSHTEKKNTLWRKFVDLSLKITKDSGKIGFIIPSSWMGSKKLLEKYYIPYTMEYINKDECKRHFPGVGSTFSFYVLKKEAPPVEHKTVIVNKDISKKISKSTIDINKLISTFGVFPRDLSYEAESILKKISSKESLEMEYNTTHHNVHKDRWSRESCETFKYPIQNTPSKVYYWNSPHRHSGLKKLLFPTTTYYKKMLLTDYGVTQSFVYYLIKENEDPEVVLHNMNNIVLDYYNECFRYANWNSVPLLKSLPRLPFDKKMSDDEVAKYFELTDAEFDLIKESVTWR